MTALELVNAPQMKKILDINLFTEFWDREKQSWESIEKITHIKWANEENYSVCMRNSEHNASINSDSNDDFIPDGRIMLIIEKREQSSQDDFESNMLKMREVSKDICEKLQYKHLYTRSISDENGYAFDIIF